MREDYPLLRASLADEYAELDGEALGELIESIYGPGATPEDVENFFKSIGKGFKKAAGAVGGFAQKALPGMLSGAMTGLSVGGPWGALVGAVAGGAGSALSKSKSKTARKIGGAIGGLGNLASTVRGGGAGGLGILSKLGGGGAAGGVGGILAKLGGGAGGAGGLLSALRGGGGAGALGPLAALGLGGIKGARRPGVPAEPGGGAASALMSLLGRPELVQAMMASQLGAFGKPQVRAGDQQIPVHAMLSTLSGLAGQAAQEAAELDEAAAESVPAYVEWAEAEFAIDADAAEGRNDAVLLALALAPNMWAAQNRPVVVNVTQPEPAAQFGDREAAFWAEFAESDESDESDEAAEFDESDEAGEFDESDESDESDEAGEDWEASESWEDGEDFEDWDSGEAGWTEEESLHAWQ